MLLPVHSRTAFRDGEFSVNTYVWGVGFIMSSICVFARSFDIGPACSGFPEHLSRGSKNSKQITQCQCLVFQDRSLDFQFIEGICLRGSILQTCYDKGFYPIALLRDLGLHHLIHRQHVQHRGFGRG